MHRTIAIVLTVLSFVAASPAVAQSGKQLSNPKTPLQFNNRGNLWLKKGSYDEAIADFNNAISLNPKYWLAFRNRGIAWVRKREYDKAIVDFNESIRLNPKFSATYNDRGVAWELKRDFTKAVADYKAVVALKPSNPHAHSVLAWLLATCPSATGRNGKLAVEHATKACELSKWKNDSRIGTLAAACAEAGDFGSAIKWMNQAIEMAPDSPWTATRRQMLGLFRIKKPYRDNFKSRRAVR